MWHEARKQEKKIRGILVNHKKRAERRREFYEKMKADPTQFLQLHGRPAKIHLDPAVALAADSPANMMPWQGQSDILIDRFDVRAHLDFIPDHPDLPDTPNTEDLSYDDRMANYERYRIIVQNDFLGIEEDKFLHQLNIEEKFGPPVVVEAEKKPGKVGKGAAIPYSYEDSTPQQDPPQEGVGAENPEEEEEEDDSDIDFDLCVDVSQVNTQQATDMNVCGSCYGMTGNDFFSFLTRDIEEKESMRQAREQEEEKAMFSGRKSRRERRAFREKRLVGRKISPPSYAARCSPTYDAYRRSESRSPSRSHSPPVPSGQITYITSFGGEEEEVEEKPLLIVPTQSSSHLRLPKKSTTPTDGHGKRPGRSPVPSRSPRGRPSPPRHVHPRRGPHRPSPPPDNSARHKRDMSSRRRDSGVSPSRHKRPRRSRTRSKSPRHWRGNRSRSRSDSRHGRNNRSRSRSDSRHGRNIRSRSRSDSRHGRNNRSRSRSDSRHGRNNKSRSRSNSRHGRNNKSRSRSDSRHARNIRSRSRSDSRHGRNNKSRSRSDSSRRRSRSSEKGKSRSPPPPPVRRYYGSRRGKSSSLDLEDSSDTDSKQSTGSKPPPHKNSSSEFGNSGAGSKHQSKGNARERLKRKMQTLLNRQYKADKKAERLRVQKQEDERQEREEELREMAIKLRRRERERRHRDRDDSDDDDSASWRSSTPSSGRLSPSNDARRDDTWNEERHSQSDKDSPSPETKRQRLVDY